MTKLSLYMTAALSIAIAWAPYAHATCCSQDSDCPRGFACVEDTQSDAGVAGSCKLESVDCHCDSDCPKNFRCVPNAATACPDSDPSHCEPVGACVAPWQAPCATDSDCGAGYRCGDGGQACDQTSCQNYTLCEQLPLPEACAKDADCPRGWTCEDDDAWSDQCVLWTGGCNAEGTCPPHVGKNQCRPPYWALVGLFQYTGPPPTRDACSAAVRDTDAGSEVDGVSATHHPTMQAARKLPQKADCQVSTPGAVGAFSAWPIALVVGVLRRRRAR